jgi:uncharacterized repeat protein (TIGR03803 family)
MTPTGIITILGDFIGSANGRIPRDLLQGNDGNLYGTTITGGITGELVGNGTVFKMTPAGVRTTLVYFTGNGENNKGRNPLGGLLQGVDGNFYGTTFGGGNRDAGTVFRMTPAGVLTTLVEFTGSAGSHKGSSPHSLVQGSDGNFYGTTENGGSFTSSNIFFKSGTIFKMTPSGVMTTLVEFTGNGSSNKGQFPKGRLVEGSDGNFYGTTFGGGAFDKGTAFMVTPNGALTTLLDFSGNGASNKGAGPDAGLVQGPDGNLYGTTTAGGSFNEGTVYRVTPGGVLTTLVEFTESGWNDSQHPTEKRLMMSNDGNFYGVTHRGGAFGGGTVFRMTSAGAITTVVNFIGDVASENASNPEAGLIEGSDGNFYGTTTRGGIFDLGTVFMVTPAGALTTLVEFTGNGASNKGSGPAVGLAKGTDGNFYGTTTRGGTFNKGTVFKMTSSGMMTTLLEFSGMEGSNKGEEPRGLVQYGNGNFYGVTYLGGALGGGTVFTMTPEGNLTTLVEFSHFSNPRSRLLQGSNGNFYGTTTGGGSGFGGTVFMMTPNGVLTTLVDFTGNAGSNRGRTPASDLIQGTDGNYYGTTTWGGSFDRGTVFKMTPTGVLTTLFDFTSDGATNNGIFPNGGLMQMRNGMFYGTTARGGAGNYGTLFSMTPGGILTTIFEALDPDIYPTTPLIESSDGTLYGTFSGDSTGPDGSIFRLVFPGSPLLFIRDLQHQDTSSAIIQTSVNARGGVTSVSVEYGINGIDFPTSIPVSVNISGFFTKLVGTTLSGLDPGSTYYYRFRAVNNAGTTMGPIQSFSTLAVPTAVTLPASDVAPNSALLNGTVNAQNFESTVVIEWGTDPNSFPNKIDINPPVTGNSPTPVSHALAGLLTGGTYYYRIVATNAGGSATSGTQSFRTLIPATATVTGATALSTTRAQVTGFVDAQGSSASVSFEYGTDGLNFPNNFAASPTSVAGDLPVEVTATLTGLTQGTTYHVRIRAQGPGGTEESEAKTFSLSILSGLVQVFPDTPPASGGSVTVNFDPTNVGAWRFAGDTQWLNSGVPYGNLAAGQRVIEFLPIPGFISPPSETVDVSGSANLTLDRLYFETPTAGTGSLTVRLKPDEISAPVVPEADRAQWRIVGEAVWRDGGTTLGSLVAGSYLVECKPVTGRETPPPIPVSLPAGDAREITLTYFTANTSAGSPPLPQSFANVSANEDLPFAHVGQIRTDVGSSTGFVVKRRVVATAGHVVFDDGTLSTVTGMRWFFQNHSGTFGPKPIEPRGSYLAAGYAKQRRDDININGGRPGEGSARSQHFDFAAIYFTEEAGRGGYGGFLASDSGEDNEFLGGASDKILAGYPTSGIPAGDAGKLHATAPFTSSLSPIPVTPPVGDETPLDPGETWTTTAVRGLGGMSGGPLFVRHQGGSYLPAAIYLGGAGQTVVRAIDSGVVDLFLRAEVSGNGGDNNTDGGVTHTSVAGNLNTTQAGSLRVNIEPAGARASGAAWQLNPEATLRASGSQKSGLSPGTYSLKFKTIEGFQAPPIQPVAVTGGQLTTITFTYAESATATPLETWRQTHFGTTANTGDAADDFDFDKDGTTNIDEFTAGTDPMNSSDVFKMATAAKSGNTFTTTCPGKAGRTYTLLRNSGLNGEWTRLGSQGPLAQDAAVTLTDTTAPPDKSFYRIEVNLP